MGPVEEMPDGPGDLLLLGLRLSVFTKFFPNPAIEIFRDGDSGVLGSLPGSEALGSLSSNSSKVCESPVAVVVCTRFDDKSWFDIVRSFAESVWCSSRSSSASASVLATSAAELEVGFIGFVIISDDASDEVVDCATGLMGYVPIDNEAGTSPPSKSTPAEVPSDVDASDENSGCGVADGGGENGSMIPV
jgi:hypothetical protein